jgi:hypothetical protein
LAIFAHLDFYLPTGKYNNEANPCQEKFRNFPKKAWFMRNMKKKKECFTVYAIKSGRKYPLPRPLPQIGGEGKGEGVAVVMEIYFKSPTSLKYLWAPG